MPPNFREFSPDDQLSLSTVPEKALVIESIPYQLCKDYLVRLLANSRRQQFTQRN